MPIVTVRIDMATIGSTPNRTVRQINEFEAIIIFLFISAHISAYNLRFLIAVGWFLYAGDLQE
jgi:hypothetical protein